MAKFGARVLALEGIDSWALSAQAQAMMGKQI